MENLHIFIKGNCQSGELFGDERITKCGHLKVIVMTKNSIRLMKREFSNWPVEIIKQSVDISKLSVLIKVNFSS